MFLAHLFFGSFLSKTLKIYSKIVIGREWALLHSFHILLYGHCVECKMKLEVSIPCISCFIRQLAHVYFTIDHSGHGLVGFVNI